MIRLLALLPMLVLLGCQEAASRSVPQPRPLEPYVKPDLAPDTGPPCPPKCPRCPNRHEIENSSAAVGGNLSPDGSERLQIDYPGERHKRNGRGTDGLGLCVWRAMYHAGDWHYEPVFRAAFDYMLTQPGGGRPGRVEEVVRTVAASKGLPVPRYLQVQDNDLEILKHATRNGIMPCVTYGISPTGRYEGKKIAHMVNALHATDNWFAVLDNNYPGANAIEWMSEKDFKRTYSTPTGRGWSIIPLTDPPPPAPTNERRS